MDISTLFPSFLPGVVTIKRTIDYEKTQKTYFVVTAADNGRPPLTSTATVNVNVININDNTPTFTEVSNTAWYC